MLYLTNSKKATHTNPMNKMNSMLKSGISNSLFILFILFISNNLSAQNTGGISGKVLDQDSEPILFANVVIGTERGTTTNEDGSYNFTALTPGEYIITARLIGFLPSSVSVKVVSGQVITVNFILKESYDALDEIVVLGQRKEIVSATRSNMELIDIPMAVQLVDRQVIKQQQIINLREVFRNISGIQNTAAWGNGSRRLEVSARGFLLTDANYRRNGLLISHEGNHYSDHIEEVQVLKGPASVLYGDVSPGGVINFVTKKPQPFDFTQVNFTTGSWGMIRPSIDFNQTLNAVGSIAMRINATYEKADSYRDFVENEYIMVAPSLSYKPNERLSWIVEGVLRNDYSVEDPGIFVPSVTLEEAESIPYNRFYGNPASRNEFTETSLVSTLQYKLKPDMQLRLTNQYQYVPRLNRGLWQNWVYSPGDVVSLSRFGINSADPANHPSLSRLDVTLVNGNQDLLLNEHIIEFGNSATFNDLRNYSNLLELNYEFNTGTIKHNAFVGFDYTLSTDRITYQRFPNAIGSFNNPDPTIINNILELNADPSPYIDTQSRTGFNIQNQMLFMDEKLHVLLGLRFNWYKRDRDYDNKSERPADYRNVIDRPVIPRLGLLYKWQPNVSVYASYAESFEVNGRHRYRPEEFLDPTLGKQFEAGFKTNFFDEKLGITLAAFELRKENQPSFILATLADERGLNYDPSEVSIDGHILYISEAQRSRGIELDLSGKITNELSVQGNYTYLQTKILDDVIFQENNELENAPNHTLGFWSNYEFRNTLKGLSFGYGIFHQGEYFGDKDNSETQLHPANTKMSVALGFETKKAQLRLNVENLTNEQTYFNSFGFYWLPQPSRRVLFTIGYNL